MVTPRRGGGLSGPANQAVQRGMRLGIFSEVVAELRKVEWPTREQLTRLTFLVILISGIVGGFLAIADFALGFLINRTLFGV